MQYVGGKMEATEQHSFFAPKAQTTQSQISYLTTPQTLSSVASQKYPIYPVYVSQ